MFLNSTFFVFYIMIFLPRSSILFTNGNGTFPEAAALSGRYSWDGAVLRHGPGTASPKN